MVASLDTSYVGVHDFGPDKEQGPDLLVTTLHGETSHDGPLFKGIQGLRDGLEPADEAIFDEYLDLDADVYSEEVAWSFIQQLMERRPDLAVRWAQVNVHRAILDCNRGNVEESIRKLWLNDGSQAPILGRLRLVHLEVMEALAKAADGVPFVFDIHTMYSFSPQAPQVSGSQALQEGRAALRSYVEAYREARAVGVRRPLDIIFQDGHGRRYSDAHLAGALLESTQSAGIQSKLDSPYNLGVKDIVSKRLLEGRVGVVVDIPKGLLRNPSIKSPLYMPEEVDDDRVDAVASTFVKAWEKRLSLTA